MYITSFSNGGKIEKEETREDAIVREIKEELDIDIEVLEKVDENYYQYEKCNVLLKVYKCKYISGEIKKIEHQQIKWVKFEDIENLDWAEADAPIVDAFLDSVPAKIDSQLDVDYDDAEKTVPSNKEIKRALQDHERKLKNQKKSGDQAEDAVMVYERDRLNNLGHPELAEKIEQISKINEAAGYDIKSFDTLNSGEIIEKHIEVKSAKMDGTLTLTVYLLLGCKSYNEKTLVLTSFNYLITENELQKFKNEKNHFIYCCIKCGRKYKLHIVDKEKFFKDEYASPIAYKVKIKIKL